jgi:hypothetical protein
MKADTISIEEYRNHILTEKEEWNNWYNPKRCSIDALIKIEVKQRGKGPNKKIYTTRTNEPGPYYDPNMLHVHIWKNSELIKNFESEQNPSVPFVEFTSVKRGLFCCICHLKNNNYSFKWNRAVYEECEEEKEIYVSRNSYSEIDYIEDPKIFPIVKIDGENFCEPDTRSVSNWTRLLGRVKFSIRNTKIIYPISNYKSLYLWPWEMTNYQRLILKIPDYKKSVIFVTSQNDKFRSDYSYIE